MNLMPLINRQVSVAKRRKTVADLINKTESKGITIQLQAKSIGLPVAILKALKEEKATSKDHLDKVHTYLG